MNSTTINLGEVTDDFDYINAIREKGIFKSAQHLDIEESPPAPSSDSLPVEFRLSDGSPIDFLLVYAHVRRGRRQFREGAQWVSKFRQMGYNTPIIFLTWERPSSIWARDFAENIYLSPYAKESSTILQMPVTIEQIKAAVDSISTMKSAVWQNCRTIAVTSWICHQLEGMLNTEGEVNKLKETLLQPNTHLSLVGTHWKKDIDNVLRISDPANFKAALAAVVATIKQQGYSNV